MRVFFEKHLLNIDNGTENKVNHVRPNLVIVIYLSSPTEEEFLIPKESIKRTLYKTRTNIIGGIPIILIVNVHF